MSTDLYGVAIIGMGGRFPGSKSIDEFWSNTIKGVDGTRDLCVEEIINSGVSPEVAQNSNYIKRGAILDDSDLFDASFFDYLPNEAAILDPQIRIFLECVQEALGDAGCDPERYTGSIGVYAGSGLNNYLLKNLLRQSGYFEDVLDFQTIISNDKDFLSTQVNYKFNLTGPGVSIQTACSTSLVAIQMAYQSLLTYQCDTAIAGGSHVRSPRAKGMLYKEGEIFSPDGFCRPFDQHASGTLFGEGAGVVVLKRLDDAIKDRDHIYGVIKGAAINNDGNQKVSYAAPSVKGQAEVVAMAHILANVTADEIGYVEGHGTGTKLGDPVEIRALSQAFGRSSEKKQYCAIGSGKSMIGHLDVAAGVAGLIRAVLALHHKTLPPTLHFTEPNPNLKLEESPFYVTKKAMPWKSNGKPRIAGVSSFGVGGTNAHAVVQEAPEVVSTPSSKRFHLLPLSAKTSGALQQQVQQLTQYLANKPRVLVEDVAYTLQTGHRQFKHRKVVLCKTLDDAVETLPSSNQTHTVKGVSNNTNTPVLFMFSGQGSQYASMGRDLYRFEPVFEQCLNACAEAVKDILGFNFLSLLYTDAPTMDTDDQVKQTAIAQPALYAVECGLAKLWEHYGVIPQAMIGHSIGEFAAAHMVGVFGLEEGARIVATRGKLMQQMQPGAMLSLRNAIEDVKYVLEGRNLDVVVVNGPELTVVGGAVEDIIEFQRELKAEDISSSLLHTSHAFHSYLMEEAVGPFVEEVSRYTLNNPDKPFVSNVTGDWITNEQATDPKYWGSQLRSPVQFSKGIETLCNQYQGVLLEVGPGQALTILSQQQAVNVKRCSALSSIRHPKQEVDDQAFFYRAMGGLWANGVDINLAQLYQDEDRYKVSLPAYPFERKRYWIDAGIGYDKQTISASASTPTTKDQSAVLADSGADTVEGRIKSIWIDLLGCEDVQPEDTFFDLGGHSLVAAQMLSRVQAFCEEKVTLELMNDHSSFAEFCHEIGPLVGEDINEDLLETGLTHREKKKWSLSPQQERLWFFYELDKSDPAYNLAQTILIEGEIKLPLLQQAVDFVVAQHEALNTLFIYKENKVIAFRKTSSVVSQLVTLVGESEEEKQLSLGKIIVANNAEAKNFSATTTEAIVYVLAEDRVALVFYIPHLLTDGLSFNLLYQQTDCAYQNLLAGRSVDEGIQVPYQYSDYAEWLSSNLKDNAPEVVAFWQSYLEGAPDMTQLPTTSARPMDVSSCGSGIHFNLSDEQSEQVRVFCQQHKVTPFVFFLAQLFVTLWKYSGQSTHVVGAPFANRQHDDITSIVGFFVDMIPIRGDIESAESFIQLVTQLNRSFAQAWDNFDVPLDKIVEASGVTRHSNAHPLFQVTFTYLSYLDNTLGTDDYTMRQMLVDRGVSEYDLSLYMWEENVFTGFFEFATDLFTFETINHLQEHFIDLMEWTLVHSSLPLAQAVLVNPDDLARLATINETQQSAYLNHSFVSLFKRAVAEHASSIATKAGDQVLSYQQLDQATDVLTQQLIATGIGTGSLVGVYTSRGINSLVSLIAILKSGAAYVPLDPNFPKDRLLYIIENSGASLLLTDTENKHSNVLDSSAVPIQVLPDTPVLHRAEQFRSPTIDPCQFAYVIYTSGSTGMPKGVPIQHESLANFLLSSAERPGIQQQDVLLALTTTSFDISFLELLLPLLKGASVVIADYYTTRDGEALSTFIEEQFITMMQATPATWSMLFDGGWKGKTGLKMLSGGEPLSKSLAAKLIHAGGELWNCYGPTECTIWSSYERIERTDKEPTIGTPMHNTQYFILDLNNNVLPPGIIGELAIGGVALSPGYHGRDDLTEKVFLDIDLPGSAARLHIYKTGDLAQITDQNTVRCLGRTDFQVKIHGYRIELSEIEYQLSSYPLVDECCCVVHSDANEDKNIVAYYRSTLRIGSGELRSFLICKLPSYMIPSIFTHIVEFPKTANRKIDRKKLPAPTNDGILPKSVLIPPSTSLECSIQSIWRKALKLEDIGVEENFFDLGGHSLIATSVIREMNNAIEPFWQVKDLFLYPTIRGMARKIQKTEEQTLPILFPVQTMGEKNPFFLVAGIYADQYHGEQGQREYEKGFLGYFSNIINVVGRDRPVYGLRARGMFQGEKIHDTIYGMADEYIKEIKKISPEGPYIIGGECLGGNLAFEVSQRLRGSGDEVKMLVLLDTLMPSLKFQFVYSLRYFGRVMRNKIKGEEVRFFSGAAVYANKLIKYRVRRYDGHVLLLANEEWNKQYPMLNWKFRATPYMSVEIVKGDHSTRLKNYGELTGAVLGKHLAMLP